MSNWARRKARSVRGGNLAIAFAAGFGGTTVVVVILGLLIGLIISGSTDKRTPEEQLADAVDAMFVSLEGEKGADAYRSETTNSYREAVKLNEFLEQYEQAAGKLGTLQSKKSTRFESQPRPGGGLEALAVYDGEFEKGPGTIYVKARKLDKKWLFDYFRVDAGKKK
jgi:hypothetical protein